MNGAEHALQAAAAAGVDVCFANPGTTEMQLVNALDAVPSIRPVLGLFEGVATGAADGYARMAERPALTVLHLGPGLANGLANLHNARRARTPVVNLVGDHATWHQAVDPPLASDIASLARPMSGWVRTVRHAAELAADTVEAVEASLRPPGQVATLIIPQDCAWEPVVGAAEALPALRRPTPLAVADEAVAGAEAAVRDGESTVLFLGGAALHERALRAAGAVRAATGCRLVQETFSARGERGAGLPAVDRLPYFPEQARETLAGTRHLVLAGTRDPVAFFGYPGDRSRMAPEDATVVTLARPEEDAAAALEALAEAVGASGATAGPGGDRPRPEVPSGPLTPETLGQALAAVQPEGAIVVEEGATTGMAYPPFAAGAPPHTVLGLTGGAIGQGLPTAVGAAVACPDRPVIDLQADGSGMYTVQALWSMAREGLDVTVVVCANRSYRILQFELLRAGVAEPGPAAMGLTDLGRPDLDWVALAAGMGVPGRRVDTADGLAEELGRCLSEPGPALLEAVLR